MGKRAKRVGPWIKFAVKLKTAADLAAPLEGNRQALDTFDAFSPRARKEYIEWETDAMNESTRNRRLEQTVEWMAQGKQRHWKYQK